MTIVKWVCCFVQGVAIVFALDHTVISQPFRGGTPETSNVAFEVASVKPVDPKAGGLLGRVRYSSGRLEFHHYTLQSLIQEAYGLTPRQVTGGPTWVSTETYDVAAIENHVADTSPAGLKSALSEDEQKMLQHLLADRFSLRVHSESRSQPVLILSRNGKALKLAPPKDPNDFPWVGGPEGGGLGSKSGLAGKNITMSELTKRLEAYLGAKIIDSTGLPGSFDFMVSNPGWEKDDLQAEIIDSLNKLGLALRPGKSVLPMLIIESASHPSPN